MCNRGRKKSFSPTTAFSPRERGKHTFQGGLRVSDIVERDDKSVLAHVGYTLQERTCRLRVASSETSVPNAPFLKKVAS